MRATQISMAAWMMVSLVLLTAGCSRDRRAEEEAWATNAAAPLGPAPKGPPPHDVPINPAPLNNVADDPGPPRAASLAARGGADVVQLGRNAAVAALSPLAGSQLEGSAQLEERADDLVQVSLDVHGGDPGKRQVFIRERGPCTVRPAASPAQGTVKALGLLRVSPQGDGKLETTLTGVNLQPGGPSTLLGKALVIADPAQQVGERLVACAQIRLR